MNKRENYFEYKGYHTRIEFDYDSLSLCGKIEGIDDFIVFESSDATKIEEEFHKAVDDYLTLCEEIGKTPEKEYKGVFNVRVSPELHRSLSTIAYEKSETLNSLVEIALENYVNSSIAIIERVNYSLSSNQEYSNEEATSESAYIYKIGEVC